MEWIKENRKIFTGIGIGILILILIASIICINSSFTKKETKGIKYSEEKDLEYKVMLKKNDYYTEDYIEKNNQYIASIIDKINAEFKYDFNIEDGNEYDYNYVIKGNVEVIDDKTSRTIYANSEDILSEKIGHSTGNMQIDENVEIAYEKYNNLINQFINVYDLKNVTAKLQLSLNLGIKGTTEQFEKKQASVMSLDIPLATNTISIDANYEKEPTNNIIKLAKQETSTQIYLILGISLLIIDIAILVAFIIILKKSASDEDKYKEELRKIMLNYDSYISKVEDEFDMEGYQILRVANFVDLLEIRDTMHLPIIMLENKGQLFTCFVIPTADKILYFYSISVKQYALASGNDEEYTETASDNETTYGEVTEALEDNTEDNELEEDKTESLENNTEDNEHEEDKEEEREEDEQKV